MNYNSFFNINPADVKKEARAIKSGRYQHEQNKQDILVVY